MAPGARSIYDQEVRDFQVRDVAIWGGVINVLVPLFGFPEHDFPLVKKSCDTVVRSVHSGARLLGLHNLGQVTRQPRTSTSPSVEWGSDGTDSCGN